MQSAPKCAIVKRALAANRQAKEQGRCAGIAVAAATDATERLPGDRHRRARAPPTWWIHHPQGPGPAHVPAR